jgi:NRAMP (natural resistance-associated macrophage protein)-like metal ion transporter
MSEKASASPTGLEPIAEVVADRYLGGRRGSTRVQLHIRGRSIPLQRLSGPPTGLLYWVCLLGPGLIASAAGNDAGGIATYSAVGARYGYDLIWVMLVITVSLAAVQETCARLGAATGSGLLDLIRERLGLGWSLCAVGVIVIANTGLVCSEFVGIGAAAELLGVSRFVAVPIAAGLLWYLVVFGNYSRVEKVFILMTVVFLAYPAAALVSRPDWAAVARGAFLPTLHRDPEYIFLLVGLIGTTITPYMQLFQQSSVVERGADRRRYGPERTDAYLGVGFSNLMSVFMIMATAATLHRTGHIHIETAADAARALEPVAGRAAGALFAIGLLGASLLAGAVLPLATAYALGEAFGFRKGVSLDFRQAGTFFGLFTVLTMIGAIAALIPRLPVIRWLVGIQVLNGLLLPVILFFVFRLANDVALMGQLKNTRLQNIVAWGTFAIVTTAIVAMLSSQLLSAFGLPVLGRLGSLDRRTCLVMAVLTQAPVEARRRTTECLFDREGLIVRRRTSNAATMDGRTGSSSTMWRFLPRTTASCCAGSTARSSASPNSGCCPAP